MKKIQHSIVIFLCILIALTQLPFGVLAADESDVERGTCGKTLTWTYDPLSYTLRISGRGSMTDYLDSRITPWTQYSRDIQSVCVDSGVTSIGSYAFSDCQSLVDVTIADTVTRIGDYAFVRCFSLPRVQIPQNVTSIGKGAFGSCRSLRAIDVDAENEAYCSVDGALLSKDKTALLCFPLQNPVTNYAIPYGVQQIEAGTFSMCVQLRQVSVPETVTEIGAWAFYSCRDLQTVTIADGVERIDDYAFNGCSALQNITLPSTLKTIGDEAFSMCNALTAIALPTGLIHIGRDAFYYCAGLTSIALPNTVQTIGDGAFVMCEKITSISIPASVERIGSAAFAECLQLQAIRVDAANRNYDDRDGVLYTADGTTVVAYPAAKTETEYAIPSSVTAIEAFAFSDCAKLQTITIPDTVCCIGAGAFSYCHALRSLTLPQSLTALEDDLFFGCEKLQSITIPNSVTQIGTSTFNLCRNLQTVTIGSGLTAGVEDALCDCWGLETILVQADNPSYSSVDGVLFNKDRTKLCLYPAAKKGTEYHIPGTTTRICARAFSAGNVSTLIVPRSVQTIDDNAFCSRTVSVTDIYYVGTQAQWAQIEIGKGNIAIENATMHYNYASAETCTHDYTVTIEREATCTVNGVKLYTCTRCGESYAEAIPMTAHTPSAWIIDRAPPSAWQVPNIRSALFAARRCKHRRSPRCPIRSRPCSYSRRARRTSERRWI